jgi:hypothetical protein
MNENQNETTATKIEKPFSLINVAAFLLMIGVFEAIANVDGAMTMELFSVVYLVLATISIIAAISITKMKAWSFWPALFILVLGVIQQLYNAYALLNSPFAFLYSFLVVPTIVFFIYGLCLFFLIKKSAYLKY